MNMLSWTFFFSLLFIIVSATSADAINPLLVLAASNRLPGEGLENDDTTVVPLHMQINPLLQIPCSIQLASTMERLTPVDTFVDTGAQVSVLSYQAASRAGVLQMIDRRYSGHALGVGQCRVLGRLPAGVLTLYLHGEMVEAPAVTVLEHTNDGVDLLLGLDFLREHLAVLNLRTEEMTIQIPDIESPSSSSSQRRDVSIPFIRPRSALSSFVGDDHHHKQEGSNDSWQQQDDKRLCLEQEGERNTDANGSATDCIDMSGV